MLVIYFLKGPTSLDSPLAVQVYDTGLKTSVTLLWRCVKLFVSLLISGLALQAVYVLFRDDDAMKLPYFIAISGVVCAMFAFATPHLSALGIWLGFSTIFSLIYVVIAIVLAARDGTISFS